jgi:hypothetical protein
MHGAIDRLIAGSVREEVDAGVVAERHARLVAAALAAADAMIELLVRFPDEYARRRARSQRAGYTSSGAMAPSTGGRNIGVELDCFAGGWQVALTQTPGFSPCCMCECPFLPSHLHLSRNDRTPVELGPCWIPIHWKG